MKKIKFSSLNHFGYALLCNVINIRNFTENAIFVVLPLTVSSTWHHNNTFLGEKLLEEIFPKQYLSHSRRYRHNRMRAIWGFPIRDLSKSRQNLCNCQLPTDQLKIEIDQFKRRKKKRFYFDDVDNVTLD